MPKPNLSRVAALIAAGALPGTAFRQAMREAAPPQSTSAPPAATSETGPTNRGAVRDGGRYRMPEVDDPRAEIRRGLLEASMHKHAKDVHCAFCDRTDLPIALHVAQFYHSDTSRTPIPFVRMSSRRGTTRGSVPVCIRCAPSCSTCALPVVTRWTAQMVKALRERHHQTGIDIGNGRCTQHFHFGSDLRGAFKRVRLPTPLRMARNAVVEVESKGDIPAFSLIKDAILATIVSDDTKTAATILEDRIDPRALVYLLATNRAFEELSSGQHHVYRGVLSVGGRQLLASFCAASEQMITYGLHDRSRHEADLASLRAEIKEMG